MPASGLGQRCRLGEVEDLHPALRDELGQEGGTSAVGCQKVHRLRDDGCGREELACESVEQSRDSGVLLFRRVDVGNEGAGVENPGFQERKLLSRR